MSKPKKLNSFKAFYPYYLSEHLHPICRGLHYAGSTFVILVALYAITSNQYMYFWLLPFIGYGFAWVGHFFIEKNRPATFTYPFYSFLGDWVMFKDFLTGQLDKKLKLHNLD